MTEDVLTQAVAEGWTLKNIPKAYGNKDCLGAACVCLLFIFVFIFYVVVNGIFTIS
jgi:hypothetical protein